MRSVHSSVLAVSVFALCLSASRSLVAQEATTDDPKGSTSPVTELPDSPGTTWARLQESSQQNSPQPAAAAPASTSSSAAPAQSQTAQETASPKSDNQNEANQKMQRPVGTAAAEAPKVNGVTAAQPAGVAIAPGKQRRVRIIVLKVGAILGAGAAIGTVVALSAATPSKPPGAH